MLGITHRNQRTAKKNIWCFVVRKNKYDIKILNSLAAEKGGACLSQEYLGIHTKHRWRCAEQHEWEAPFNSIRRGRWCPKCARSIAGRSISERYNNPHELGHLSEHATNLGGECLSTSYEGVTTSYKWQCAQGHKWEASWHNVRQGQWCYKCGRAKVGDNMRGSIESIALIVIERGGKCLSPDSEYKSAHSKLKFECAAGHRFTMNSNSVQQGQWCSDCSSSRGERMCRMAFEQIFGLPFPRKKPKWLKNEAGNLMELDGYCEKLSLAFEHHGNQHYSKGNLFVQTNKELADRIYADKYKRNLCEQNGITLIEIPEIGTLTAVSDLKSEIKGRCEEQDVLLPSNFDSITLRVGDVYAQHGLAEMQALATDKGGTCLATEYQGARTPIKWQCGEGHQWKASPDSVKRSSWCPTCGGRPSYTITDLIDLARERGGSCLSDEYINAHAKYRWRCVKCLA